MVALRLPHGLPANRAGGG
jgi:hypothetical protein